MLPDSSSSSQDEGDAKQALGGFITFLEEANVYRSALGSSGEGRGEMGCFSMSCSRDIGAT